MPEWTDRAIILRCGHFREADIWVKALLENYGIYTLFAFGGAKSRKRFCGCLDILDTLNCRIKISRNGQYHNLEEATLLCGPRLLRDNWQASGIAANCMLFLEALAIGPETSHECFILLENLRDTLELAASPLIQHFFRLRIAAALGYAPDFSRCGQCGKAITDNSLFLVDAGQTLCEACQSHKGWHEKRLALPVDAETCRELTRHQRSLPASWAHDDFSRSMLRQCGRVIDAFVQFHLGLEWDNGFFRHV